MVASTSAAQSSAGLQLLQQIESLFTTNSTNSSATTGLTALTGSTSTGSSSATISGPGQLYSELQQLQSQNPTQFKQVVTEIASQLSQAASADGSTGQGNFLSTLAQKFQNVADGGSLSQLAPPSGGSGHKHAKAYADNSQSSSNSSELTALLSQLSDSQSSSSSSSSSTSSSGTNLQQLFQSIQNEVSQALSAQS
jgi:hypothetical protein